MSYNIKLCFQLMNSKIPYFSMRLLLGVNQFVRFIICASLKNCLYKFYLYYNLDIVHNCFKILIIYEHNIRLSIFYKTIKNVQMHLVLSNVFAQRVFHTVLQVYRIGIPVNMFRRNLFFNI